ncbi:hypothetical protein ACGFNU_27690 [Spirillospora sp. NPDC048911]|uniref:NACHT N-terminal helical domain 7-containing protein n=1 Tax=Spirillospora sp. NPDC048911 TaxID=3364527 RepID=UPI00370F8658
MSSRLSYADAVKLLGGDSKVVTALDKLTGGLLLAATGGGSELAVSLFDAKAELVRHSHELVNGLAGRMRGLSRFDRTERLAAAHLVLVTASFFEAVREAELPFDEKELKLSRSQEISLSGAPLTPNRLAALAESLLRLGTIPVHSPRKSHEQLRDDLLHYYEVLGRSLIHFIEGLEVWDRLHETARTRLRRALVRDVPGAAVRRSAEDERLLATSLLLRQLAADADRLPREWRASVLVKLRDRIMAQPDELLPWARQAFHDLDLEIIGE